MPDNGSFSEHTEKPAAMPTPMAGTDGSPNGALRPPASSAERPTGSRTDSNPSPASFGAAAADGGPKAGLTDPQTASDGSEITEFPKLRGQDINGCPITEIFWSTNKFVIYEAGDQIKYQLPPNYEVAKTLRRRAADLGGLRASIENLRAEPSLASNEKKRAAREVAWALAQAFEDTSDPPSQEPKEVLTRVDARLRSLVKSYYRKRYALSNLAAFFSIELVLIGVAILFGLAWALAGSLAAIPRYSLFAAFGALGAFLSVITGIRTIDVDLNLKTWEHVFAGATRIMIGVIGALLIGLALDSGLIDPTFGFHGRATTANSAAGTVATSGLDKHLAMCLIFAFLAGFSESLVPNLLRKGEQAAGATDKPNSADDAIVKDMKP